MGSAPSSKARSVERLIGQVAIANSVLGEIWFSQFIKNSNGHSVFLNFTDPRMFKVSALRNFIKKSGGHSAFMTAYFDGNGVNVSALHSLWGA